MSTLSPPSAPQPHRPVAHGMRFSPRVGYGQLVAALLSLLLTGLVDAQILRGPWVEQTQEDIDRHRMTDLQIILLDAAGVPAPEVEVHIRMVRHAFIWGVHLDEPHDLLVDSQGPLAGAINAVALDRVSAWPRVQPDPSRWDFTALDGLLNWCDHRGLEVRFGSVTSGDPEWLPGWVLDLDDAHFARALSQHTQTVVHRYGRRLNLLDLHTHAAGVQLVRTRLGMVMLRRLHEEARAAVPNIELAARFNDVLSGQNLPEMRAALHEIRDEFVRIDALAIDETVTGTLLQAPLARAAASLRTIGLPVTVGRLEVSGSSATASAVNLEMMLRVLFAEPAIGGIYLASPLPGDSQQPHTALIDERGELTASGRVFHGLVRALWWTDERIATDDLGSIRMRAFAGTYELTADLPDGRRAQMRVHLPLIDHPRIVLLQPLPVDEPRDESADD